MNLVRVIHSNKLFTITAYKEILLSLPNINVSNINDILKQQEQQNEIKIF